MLSLRSSRPRETITIGNRLSRSIDRALLCPTWHARDDTISQFHKHHLNNNGVKVVYIHVA